MTLHYAIRFELIEHGGHAGRIEIGTPRQLARRDLIGLRENGQGA